MNDKKLLEELKMLKGIQDNLQDNLLKLIITDSIERILSAININRQNPMQDIPPDLVFVVRDVAAKRFNRLNAEGTTKMGEEGSNFEWQDDYLKEYQSLLQKYADKPDNYAKGIARFI